MNNKGCDSIKKKLFILILFLILPINVFAVYDVIDSRCTTDIKTTLRETAKNFTYSIEKKEDNAGVYYNIELLNIDKTIYIKTSIDSNEYFSDSTLREVEPGTLLKLYIYASNKTYCEGYKINTISVQIPYYNKYSKDSMCIGYESYALCNPESNLNITRDEFETQMKVYIASLNNGSNDKEEENSNNENIDSSFDLVDFIIEYSDYISGLGWILLVIYIAAVIERLNKKRGIL